MKSVLLINSYHSGFEWGDAIVETVKREFDNSELNIDLSIEYMDTKRLRGKGTIGDFKRLIEAKYGAGEIDLLMASDDNAYQFLLANRSELFPETRIVFLGVNDYDPEQLEGLRSRITGQVQKNDIYKTARAALRQNPGADTIAFIHDGSPTGIGYEKEFQRIWPLLKEKRPGLKKEYITGKLYSSEEMLQRVAHLPSNYIAILNVWTCGTDGVLLSLEQSFRTISAHASVPLYGTLGNGMGRGLVGGRITSPEAQAEAAAAMALELLMGRPIEDIPVRTDSTNRYIFDYEQLERWHIDRSTLPVQYELINSPDTVFSRYAHIIWPILIFLCIQSIMILVLMINISVKRKREREILDLNSRLEQSREQLDLALMGANNGVWDFNIREQTLHYDERYYTMAGYAPDEFPAREEEWTSRIHPEDREKAVRSTDDYIGGRTESHDVEYRFRRKDGSYMWIHGQGKIVRKDEAGRPLRFIGTHSDITAHKLVEEKNRKLEDQLRHAQKLESLGVLVGGVAHDFNNILASIMGFTELALMQNRENKRLQDYLENIRLSGRRARDLTSQLLSFSRRSPGEKQPLDLSSLLKESIRMIRAAAPSSIEINSRGMETGYAALADPSRIHQVFMNLLTNAVHAVRDNAGSITVSQERVDLPEGDSLLNHELEAGSYVKITVSDTGHGIPKENLNMIFDPFFTTKKDGEGTGLGLSVSYGIIKETGGDISVYSEEGKGSSFQILLPLIPDDINSDTPQEREALLKGSGHILLVDDEKDIVSWSSDLLSTLGYTVTGESDSRRALKIFEESPHSFDLVITDLTMPGLSGLDITAGIRELNPDLPVILCTGFDQGLGSEDAASRGISHIIRKPYAAGEISRVIRRFISRASGIPPVEA